MDESYVHNSHWFWCCRYDLKTQQIKTDAEVAEGSCLSLTRTWPVEHPALDPWDGRYKRRFADMMRQLKSVGINGISLTDVNSCGRNVMIFDSPTLRNITANLGPIMAAWGITPYFSACYAAPFLLANVSASPFDPATARWWADKVNEIKAQLPGFGGFVVKADAEGNLGPQGFNATEASADVPTAFPNPNTGFKGRGAGSLCMFKC